MRTHCTIFKIQNWKTIKQIKAGNSPTQWETNKKQNRLSHFGNK